MTKYIGLIIAIISLTLSSSLIYAKPTVYPVTITDIEIGPQNRDSHVKYSITVKAYRTVNLQIDVDIYIPGIGWSGWKTLWTGKLSANNTKTVSSKYYIPEDAATGTVVIWINAKYYSQRDHDVINGKNYYGDYSMVVTAGTIADPFEKYWYTMYKKLKQNYTTLQDSYNNLNENYIVLKTLYSQLEKNYNKLNETYNSLKTNYQKLEQDYKILQDKYDTLKTENKNLKTWINNLLILIAIISIAFAYMAIKQYQQKQECLKALERAHTYKQSQ